MPAPWMPGATVLDIGNHAPTDGGPAKAVAHVTWDKNATAAAPSALVPYANLAAYFGQNPTGMGMAPHLLWDPFTGGCTQFLPANSRSLSLVDLAGGTRTNRAGSVVIQIEALFFPYCKVDGKVYPRLVDTPCLGWDALHAWVKSWGVPDVWPMGRPVDFTSNRSESVWETRAGWYGHQQVPENTHQDPGSWPAFPVAPKPVPAPTPTSLKEPTMLMVTIDRTTVPKTPPTSWPGDFLLTEFGALIHIATPEDEAKLSAKGVPGPITITYSRYLDLLAGK